MINISIAELNNALRSNKLWNDSHHQKGNRFTVCGCDDYDLSHLCFMDMDLRGVVFDAIRLEGVNFSGADLSGACFDGCTLVGVSFLNADLTKASFVGTKFDTCDFRYATLRDAILYNVDMSTCIGFDTDWIGASDGDSVKFQPPQSMQKYTSNGDEDEHEGMFLSTRLSELKQFVYD